MAGRFGAVQSGQRKSLVFLLESAEVWRPFSPAAAPPMSHAAFKQAQQRYARTREAAYRIARDDAIASGRVGGPLRLTECTLPALLVWRSTWTAPHPSGAGGWDWEPLMRRAWKQPSAFHLAIWSGEVLCGLAVGRASRQRSDGVRDAILVDYVESAPDLQHPLRRKVAFLATSAADAYGRVLGAEWLRLIDPLPGALRLYSELGFEVVRDENRVLYCERRIQP